MAPPISVEQRRVLLASTSILKALGHAGFDRLLLEFGVPEDVGSGSSLMARANSLARYALSYSEARTPSGSTLTTEIIARAGELFDKGVLGNVTDREISEFESALGFAQQQIDQKPPKSLQAPEAKVVVTAKVRPPARRKIFIVHGHDDGSRETVARFISKLDFEPIILHERPNRGRTIITKFQQEAADVGFAVVLMTPDDEGANRGGKLNPRARQNVVFELGFFIGVLGPERVAAILKGELEKPSDFDGVAYISLDKGTWKQALAKELEAAGFEIDWRKAMT